MATVEMSVLGEKQSLAGSFSDHLVIFRTMSLPPEEKTSTAYTLITKELVLW